MKLLHIINQLSNANINDGEKHYLVDELNNAFNSQANNEHSQKSLQLIFLLLCTKHLDLLGAYLKRYKSGMTSDLLLLLITPYKQTNLKSVNDTAHSSQTSSAESKEDRTCPVTFQPITLEDGVFYQAVSEAGHINYAYLENILALVACNKICPTSRSQIKWFVFCRDIPYETLEKLEEVKDHKEIIPFVKDLVPKRDIKQAQGQTWESSQYIGCSSLYLLTAEQDGRSLLKYWLYKSPDSFNRIPPAAWMHACTAEEPDKGVTPLWWLAASESGQPLLKYWLDKSPDSFKMILPAAWMQACTAEGPYKGITPLWCLAASQRGQPILKYWLDKSPDSFNRIPPAAWMQACTAEGPYKGITPLWCLAQSQRGQPILKYWLDKSPDSFNRIPPAAWMHACTAEGPFKGKTPLCLLRSTAVGRIILQSLPYGFIRDKREREDGEKQKDDESTVEHEAKRPHTATF